jgi:flagellar basal-body rod protein FlgG
MDPTIRTAATGMAAQQLRVEVIANNLANVNTTAFKRSRAHFEDLLYQMVQGPATTGNDDAQTAGSVQIGRGTRLSGVQRIDLQGPLEQTGRPLDVAIEGDGFLQVRMPDGTTAYTRDGSLNISDQGALVTHSGYLLEPPITIPQNAREIMIGKTGIVSARTDEAGTTTELGRIELARFINPAGLEAAGENIYLRTPASGDPSTGYPQENGFGRLLQGSLEGSNVEVVQEMVDMIAALRAYEVSSKALKSAEQMSEMANGLVR